MKTYYSHGKLLLTAEYVVLDGALALAIPTKKGQSLEVNARKDDLITWKSYNQKDALWFEETFKIKNNEILKQVQNDDSISNRLLNILNTAKNLNPDFLSVGHTIKTRLEFPNNWGLGTSSTLINNIATWAEVNPYRLLEKTFGGSGYDIACAAAKTAITYRINNTEILNQVQGDITPDIKSVLFNPSFKAHLYFVHLNQKQNSRDGISQYRKNTSDLKSDIERINRITKNITDCKSLERFQDLIDSHEAIISDIIKQQPVKQRLFSDFKGSIKSLGAWGGDFILVASKENPKPYFESKGYATILKYSEMVLK